MPTALRDTLTPLTKRELQAVILASCVDLTARFPDTPCADVRAMADTILQERYRG
jgi:hypothetical protein